MKPAYLNRLTLRQIQVFLAVCRLNSYSKAAEELALTQPAVSAQIRQLEELIGEPLLDYLGKQLYLTPAGEALRRAGRDLLQRLVSLEMELSELHGVMQGTLNLAVESSAQYFMPGAIASFCAQHKAVNVELEVINHSEALRRLADNRDDLVVMGLVPDIARSPSFPFATMKWWRWRRPRIPCAVHAASRCCGWRRRRCWCASPVPVRARPSIYIASNSRWCSASASSSVRWRRSSAA